MLDATALIAGSGYTPKEVEDALNFFDFSLIEPHNLIGGSLTANILLCKKAKF